MESLDILQRFERGLSQYNAFQNVSKRWLFEIISWTMSAASMVCIGPPVDYSTHTLSTLLAERFCCDPNLLLRLAFELRASRTKHTMIYLTSS